MNKILLSAITIISLASVSLLADSMDDIMQSKSSVNATDKSEVATRNSGSSKNNRAASDAKQLHEFASVNSDQLAKEIAAGHGEMVDTLATLLKVEDKALFISKLQANYGKIYTSSDMQASEVLSNISNI